MRSAGSPRLHIQKSLQPPRAPGPPAGGPAQGVQNRRAGARASPGHLTQEPTSRLLPTLRTWGTCCPSLTCPPASFLPGAALRLVGNAAPCWGLGHARRPRERKARVPATVCRGRAGLSAFQATGFLHMHLPRRPEHLAPPAPGLGSPPAERMTPHGPPRPSAVGTLEWGCPWSPSLLAGFPPAPLAAGDRTVAAGLMTPYKARRCLGTAGDFYRGRQRAWWPQGSATGGPGCVGFSGRRTCNF